MVVEEIVAYERNELQSARLAPIRANYCAIWRQFRYEISWYQAKERQVSPDKGKVRVDRFRLENPPSLTLLPLKHQEAASRPITSQRSFYPHDNCRRIWHQGQSAPRARYPWCKIWASPLPTGDLRWVQCPCQKIHRNFQGWSPRQTQWCQILVLQSRAPPRPTDR